MRRTFCGIVVIISTTYQRMIAAIASFAASMMIGMILTSVPPDLLPYVPMLMLSTEPTCSKWTRLSRGSTAPLEPSVIGPGAPEPHCFAASPAQLLVEGLQPAHEHQDQQHDND
jgi:hypothetical protein